MGRNRSTDEEVAIKIVNKSQVQNMPNLQNEIEILRKCKHPHIVALKAVFDSDDDLYIVMELVRGGELFDEIVRRNKFTEQDASIIMKQVVSALEYLHSNGIIHRDVKVYNQVL